MGSLYRRKGSRFWWLGFIDANGERRLVSSGTEDEAEAQKLLAALERAEVAKKEAGIEAGPLTVRAYAEKSWLPARRARGVLSVDKDEDCLAHAYPVIGKTPLDRVRRKDLLDLVRGLEAKRTPEGEPLLAPRSVLHVYATLRVMFGDAMAAELITGTPCTLSARRGELPKKRDKDPAWRATAIYTRAEVEELISDQRIPGYRRMLYGLIFLAGLRINEATPRLWRDWDTEMEPLGRLAMDSHWDILKKVLRPGSKTGPGRNIPVHPTLAKMLAGWRLAGFELYTGQKPKPGDLIVPAPREGILNCNRTLEALHQDLAMLGHRARRQHDARRTFISLARGDGADSPLLKWITHGPSKEIIDEYTTPEWSVLCGLVAKLKIHLREGKVLKMAATAVLQHQQPSDVPAKNHGREGTRTLPRGAPQSTSGPHTSTETGVSPAGGARTVSDAPSDCSNCSNSDHQDAQARADEGESKTPRGGR